MDQETEDRLRDIEDGFLAYFALIAANIPEAVEGQPVSPQEVEACQLRLWQALTRMRERALKH